jgi:hypothetical protein
MLARRLSPRRCPRASSLRWSTCTRRWRRPAAARSATPPAPLLPRTHILTHTRPPAAPPAHRRTPRRLNNNKIGDAGAAALAKALPASQLTKLQYVHAPLAPPRRCPLRDASRSLAPSHTHTNSHPPARRAPRTPPHAAQLEGQRDRRCWRGGSRQGAAREPAHSAEVRARAAGAAPPLPAPRRQPLPRSLAHTYSLTPARPPRPPHTAARRAAWRRTRLAMLARRLLPWGAR